MLLWNHTILHKAHSPLSFCKHHDWNSPHMSWLSTYWFFSREMWFRCAPFLKSCLPQLLESPSVVLCVRDGLYERRFHFKKEFRSTTATWLLSSRSCPMIRVKKCRNFANYFLALRPQSKLFRWDDDKNTHFCSICKTDFQHSLIFLEEGIIIFLPGQSVAGQYRALVRKILTFKEWSIK